MSVDVARRGTIFEATHEANIKATNVRIITWIIREWFSILPSTCIQVEGVRI